MNIILSVDQVKKFSVQALQQKMETDANGLSSTEAKNRLEQFGPNKLIEKKKNPFLNFLSYFWGPIPWMIEVAVIISGIMYSWDDFWIILTLLVFNAVVGFWQEYKADNAIELLKKKLALSTRVKRDGVWKDLSASSLVPGDVVQMQLGDIIPADVKVFGNGYLSVDEAALTGESLPVDKRNGDVVYSGAVIKQGEMEGIVFGTGEHTFFGRTTKLVTDTKNSSHFQKAIMKIGNYLIIFAVTLVTIIFLVSIFRHDPLLESLHFSLVLIVAAIPAALPAVLSVTMAIGAIELSKRQAIVSRLVAIEEMAGMDVLCFDKTGTITQNKLTVGQSHPFGKYTEADVLLYATLASKEEDRDAIDDAIFKHTHDDIVIKKKLNAYTMTAFVPFDPVKKRTESTVKLGRTIFHVSKGAPQMILELVGTEGKIKDDITQTVTDFAKKGYRALGVARKTVKGKWDFVGMLALLDPARDDSADTIAKARAMGVSVKMITGDHIAIAEDIGEEVGLGKNMVVAEKLIKLSDTEAENMIENSDGFAEVFPEHKFRIVKLLQHHNHIVGMTGDGVNDAPALKVADVGIAVDGATDAAKSVADIVFTKPGISVIIDAIEESRKIFHRMTHYAIYRIAETIRVLLFITLSILVFQSYPVTALMIVLLAILNDAPIMTIAYDHVKFSHNPEHWDMKTLLEVATFLGIVGVFSSFGIYYIGRVVMHLSPLMLQSFIYLKLSVAGQLTVFVARTKHHFWSIKPAKILLAAVIITQSIATIIVVYGIVLPPIGWGLALFVWVYALVLFLITDLLKVQFYRFLGMVA